MPETQASVHVTRLDQPAASSARCCRATNRLLPVMLCQAARSVARICLRLHPKTDAQPNIGPVRLPNDADRTAGGRQLGVWAATAVVTGEAISLGIFLTPAGMARSLGSPALLAAVWCGMALITLAGALCFTELAVRNPHDGGEYVYLRRGFGRRVAFLYGWMAAIVMYPGIAAALCVGSVPYIQALVPVPAPVATAIPALILLTLGALNYFGTRLSSGVMTVLNWLKIPVLVALVGWALISGHATMANLAPLTLRRPGLRSAHRSHRRSGHQRILLFRRLVGSRKNRRRSAQSIAQPFDCIFRRRAHRHRALSAASASPSSPSFPCSRFSRTPHSLPNSARRSSAAAGGRVLSACVVLCVLGGLMVLSMAVPRVTYALALGEAGSASQRGPLAAFARLHPRFGTPANAVLLQTGMALLVLSFGAFDRILAFIIFSAVVFLALTVATLFRAITPVRRWWFPLAPIVFIAWQRIARAHASHA